MYRLCRTCSGLLANARLAGVWVFLFIVCPSIPAAAIQVTAQSAEVQISRDGDVVTVTGRVVVKNGERAAIQGVVVERADGASVYVGDIPAKGQELSPIYTIAGSIAGWPSRSLKLPVTLRFTYRGSTVAVPSTLYFFLPR